MMYDIKYHPKIKKDLKKIPSSVCERTIRIIEEKLRTTPMEFGEYLHFPLHPYRKLKVGSFRIVYKTSQATNEVLILCIGERKNDEVYDEALKRKE